MKINKLHLVAIVILMTTIVSCTTDNPFGVYFDSPVCFNTMGMNFQSDGFRCNMLIMPDDASYLDKTSDEIYGATITRKNIESVDGGVGVDMKLSVIFDGPNIKIGHRYQMKNVAFWFDNSDKFKTYAYEMYGDSGWILFSDIRIGKTETYAFCGYLFSGYFSAEIINGDGEVESVVGTFNDVPLWYSSEEWVFEVINGSTGDIIPLS